MSHHKLSREYIAYLADAAAVLSKLRGSNGEKQQLMVANLGPSWGLPAVYKTFESSVLELDGWTAWERPPGIGSMPLDVVFSVCRTVFTWLHGSSSHIVVRAKFHLKCICALASSYTCTLLQGIAF